LHYTCPFPSACSRLQTDIENICYNNLSFPTACLKIVLNFDRSRSHRVPQNDIMFLSSEALTDRTWRSRLFSHAHPRSITFYRISTDRLDTGACLNRRFFRSNYTIKSYAFVRKIDAYLRDVYSKRIVGELEKKLGPLSRYVDFITVLLREKKRKIKERKGKGRKSLIKKPDLRGSRCQ